MIIFNLGKDCCRLSEYFLGNYQRRGFSEKEKKAIEEFCIFRGLLGFL